MIARHFQERLATSVFWLVFLSFAMQGKSSQHIMYFLAVNSLIHNRFVQSVCMVVIWESHICIHLTHIWLHLPSCLFRIWVSIWKNKQSANWGEMVGLGTWTLWLEPGNLEELVKMRDLPVYDQPITKHKRGLLFLLCDRHNWWSIRSLWHGGPTPYGATIHWGKGSELRKWGESVALWIYGKYPELGNLAL